MLAFDPQGRQSSRRAVPEAAAAAAQRGQWGRETRRLAKALGVTESAMKADGERLYYFGPALAAIEAAYARNAVDGRRAAIAALTEYHELGYETGHGDGAAFGQRGRQA